MIDVSLYAVGHDFFQTLIKLLLQLGIVCLQRLLPPAQSRLPVSSQC